MCRVYIVVINTFSPIGKIVRLDHENDVVIMSNSPVRLMVGGGAMLIKLASNHHAAISGRRVCKPRAKIIVRL